MLKFTNPYFSHFYGYVLGISQKEVFSNNKRKAGCNSNIVHCI